MITWGAVGNSHDASLAVFNYNHLVWAGLAKDFSGVNHDPNLNKEMLDYAIDHWGYPSYIYWYERPFLKTLRQLRAGQGWLLKENNIRTYFKNRRIPNPSIKYIQHHHSHAAYAYYTQPHDDCAVICLDSIGEFETLTMWHGKNNKLKKIYSLKYPHSLGLWYSAMTQRIGLIPQQDEHMISTLAAKGDPDVLRNIMLNDFFLEYPSLIHPKIKLKENLHRGCLWWRPELKSKQDMYNIAATTQMIFEDMISWLSAWVRFETGSKNLALAGGGALNKPAIDNIRSQWNNVHVPLNPGDPGSCIGCVLADKKIRIDSVDKLWN